MFDVIPSIDLLNGQVVRLKQGKFDDVRSYGSDPDKSLQKFAEAGARRVHIVDLDGAQGHRPQTALIDGLIRRNTSLKIQVGGGIRTTEQAQRYFDVGVSALVVSTWALRNPFEVSKLCNLHPNAVIVAVDGWDGFVAIDGWKTKTETKVVELAKDAESWGAREVLFTDIAKDGMAEGPSVQATRNLQRALTIPVIASGGIRSVADLLELQSNGIQAAVIGRALHEGEIDLSDAVEVLRNTTEVARFPSLRKDTN